MSEEQSTTVDPVECRDVPGYPGYRVGSDGTVWTLWTPGQQSRLGSEWRRLNEYVLPRGYHAVNIPKSRSTTGRPQNIGVHRLVALAFHGPCPPGQEVRHYNGKADDNRATNLLYGTHLQNVADSRRHGTMARGSRHGSAKLDEERVRHIKLRLDRGESIKSIAQTEGVTRVAILYIKHDKTWTHVPWQPLVLDAEWAKRARANLEAYYAEKNKKHRRARHKRSQQN